jgi:large subunit ribosomal protein L24|tara:strand:- start:138 stop:449 length:312 start_codon:yes stop_codon:yes gene_type:complete
MRIKKGDTVKVIAGKDKGKTGKVLQAFPKISRVSVEGVNVMVKHMRSQQKGQEGQKIEFPSPIQVSNVALLCPQCGKPAKIGFEISEDKKTKNRVCKKCKKAI